ncbi:MAG: histidine kinase dimerization/phospho-acceptor domain-containing protein [Burkholderiaceae bacterium]
MNLQPSLFRHLLGWALGALLVVWASFVWVGYRTGEHEADELTDGHLASVAALLLAQRIGEFVPGPWPSTSAPAGRPELRAHDYQRSLSVVVWDGQGRVLSRTGEAPTPPFTPQEGFFTQRLGQPAVGWRAFSRWDGPARERKVAVLLSVDARDDLAADIAEQVAEPGLWLLPVVALVLVLAIRKGLRPLLDLSEQVHRLDIHHDTTLQAPPHEEFRDIVQAIHLLIERYTAALSRERKLASEVAHELRTPLASLGLHASSLRGALTPAERSEALARVEHEAARANAVLTHVLALARASRTELDETRQPLDLADLARGVAAEYGQPAWQSGHELSVDAPEHCPARGHPVLLEMALRNLIDNALAYTPRGTAVQVIVTANPPALEVRDNGRAVGAQGASDTAPRHNLGMGLGHEVVQRVAAVHGGRFERTEGSGTEPARYRVILDDG